MAGFPAAAVHRVAAARQEVGSLSIKLNDKDRKKVETAIKAAEKKTSAEFFAVLTEQSDDYRFIAYFFYWFWLMVLSVLVAGFLNWHQIEPGLLPFVFAQLCGMAFIIVLLMVFPKLALTMVPARIAHRRAHLNATRQFFAHGIHTTSSQRGVLVFVSLNERFAEIVVDHGIEQKCGQKAFLEIIPHLTERCAKGEIIKGYVTAIEKSADMLAAPFPPKKKKQNELDDKLVIL